MERTTIPSGVGPPTTLPSGVVTFLLTDIEGSTRLWDTHPQAMAVALERHDEIVARVVGKAGGTLLKSRGEGDSTFSVFGRPTDAVAAAFAAQGALTDEAWPTGVEIRVRMALHTGEVAERDGDYYGGTVNRAARLRALARGGEILLSGSCAELVRDRLPPASTLAELGELRLRDLARPERVHALRVEEPVTNRTEPPASTGALPAVLAVGATGALTFVGRERELARVSDAWARARAGAFGLVLLSGEPGVGKTRLAAELAASVPAEQGLVLAGRSDEGLGVPYQPFVEALQCLARDPLGLRAAAGLGRLGGELGRLLPDLADTVPGLAPPVGADFETERYRLFEAVAAWLTAVSRERPVLLVLDDLHWAAPSTLLLLRHLGRAATTSRLLVVATYRDTELLTTDPVTSVLADLRRAPGTVQVVLTGLGPDAVALLVRSAAAGSHPADDTADTGFAELLRRETNGNPFFLGELLRDLAEAPAGDRGRVPEGVRDVVGNRLARLSGEVNRVLSAAAVMGAEFGVSVLERVAPDVLDGLDEAVRARLVVEERDRPDRYRFAHALVRHTIYESLTGARRLKLHLAVAEAFDGDGADAHPVEVANHLCAALPLGDARRAVAAVRLAGDLAMSALAYEQAITHYGRALAAFDGSGRPPDVERCELLLSLGHASAGAGDVGAAGSAFEAAAGAARTLDLPDHLARAALGFQAELVTGGQVWERRLALLEEAAQRLGPGATTLRVRTLAMLAHVLAALRPGPRVGELSDEAVAIATELGDPGATAAALHARHQALAFPSHAEQRLELASRVVELSDLAADGSWAMVGRHDRVGDLLQLGDMAAVDGELEGYAAAAGELRRPFDMWRVVVMRAMRATLAGHLDEGERLTTEALALGTRLQQPGVMQAYVVQLFVLRWVQGRLDEVLPSAATWADDDPSVPLWQFALTAMEAEAGRPDQARARLRTLARDNFADLAPDNLWLGSLALAAEAAWSLRPAAEGADLLALLEPMAARNVTVGTSIAFGSAARSAGLAAGAAGRWHDAVRHLEAAVAANDRMGAPVWSADAAHALGQALLARGEPGDDARGRALLADARRAAQTLGLERLLRRPVP